MTMFNSFKTFNVIQRGRDPQQCEVHGHPGPDMRGNCWKCGTPLPKQEKPASE